MSKPSANGPQAALADVEQRIVAAAKEREESATGAQSQARTGQR